MTAVAQAPITDTYHDIRDLIRSFCRRFAEDYGGDSEEYISEAHVAFMRCCTKWESGHHVKFITYLTTSIRNQLISHIRYESYRKHTKLPRHIPNTQNDSYTFWNDLSEDAAEVIYLVLDTPSDLFDMLGGVETRRQWKKKIREYLRLQGWSLVRIRTSFTEITDVFSLMR